MLILKRLYFAFRARILLKNFCFQGQSPILKFYLQWNMTVTLEVPRSYPQDPPFISLSSTELTNTERCHLESELRNLASKNVGFPVIMDLVTKMQHLVEDFYSKKIMTDEKQTTQDKGILKCFANIILFCFIRGSMNIFNSFNIEFQIIFKL